MKKRYVIFLILVIIVAFIAGYIWQTTHKLSNLAYTIQEISIDGSDINYKINAEYPLISSGIPSVAKIKINDDLKKWVTDSVQKAKEDFEELSNDPYIADRDIGLTYVGKVSVKSDFEKMPFINVVIETYYYSGGAHGITDVSSFVYNALDGNKLTLADVFVEGYLPKLGAVSLEALKVKDPNLETYVFAEDGTKPDTKNFQTWTLQPDGMHIVFSDYQVGPYVTGRPEIILAYDKLADFLNKNIKKIILK